MDCIYNKISYENMLNMDTDGTDKHKNNIGMLIIDHHLTEGKIHRISQENVRITDNYNKYLMSSKITKITT